MLKRDSSQDPKVYFLSNPTNSIKFSKFLHSIQKPSHVFVFSVFPQEKNVRPKCSLAARRRCKELAKGKSHGLVEPMTPENVACTVCFEVLLGRSSNSSSRSASPKIIPASLYKVSAGGCLNTSRGRSHHVFSVSAYNEINLCLDQGSWHSWPLKNRWSLLLERPLLASDSRVPTELDTHRWPQVEHAITRSARKLVSAQHFQVQPAMVRTEVLVQNAWEKGSGS